LLFNVESGRFFLALSFLGFFSLLVFYVLELLLLLLFYFNIVAIIRTTTTIISNSVSKGKRTLETSYKLWSFEFRNFEGRKEWVALMFVLLPALGLGSTHTHTHKVWLQYKICTRWCNPTYICFPCTWVLRLAFGLCTLVCFWTCSHVVSSPCSNFGRRRRKRRE
jgi:hypothetical protein